MEERNVERKRYLEQSENTLLVKRPRSEEPTSSAPHSISHDKVVTDAEGNKIYMTALALFAEMLKRDPNKLKTLTSLIDILQQLKDTEVTEDLKIIRNGLKEKEEKHIINKESKHDNCIEKIPSIDLPHNLVLKPHVVAEIDSSSSQNVTSLHHIPVMPTSLTQSTSLNRPQFFKIDPLTRSTDTSEFSHEELIKRKVVEAKVPALAAAPSIISKQNVLVNNQSRQIYNMPLMNSQDVLQRQSTEQIFMKSQVSPLPKNTPHTQKVELQQKGEILQNLHSQREKYFLNQRNKYQEILQLQQQQHKQQQMRLTTNQQNEIKAADQIRSIYGNQIVTQQISDILKNPALVDPTLMPKIIANLTQQSRPQMTPTMLSPREKQITNVLPSPQPSAAHIALGSIYGTVPSSMTQLQAQHILLNSAKQMQHMSSNTMSQTIAQTATAIPAMQPPAPTSLMSLSTPAPQEIAAALSIINANTKPAFQTQSHIAPTHVENTVQKAPFVVPPISLLNRKVIVDSSQRKCNDWSIVSIRLPTKLHVQCNCFHGTCTH